MSDDRQVPGLPEEDARERRPNQPIDSGLPGEDSDSGMGGTTDPEASRNRRDGLRKDGELPPDED